MIIIAIVTIRTSLFQARVNIASPSTRTVEKQTAASDFTTEPGLQVTKSVSFFN